MGCISLSGFFLDVVNHALSLQPQPSRCLTSMAPGWADVICSVSSRGAQCLTTAAAMKAEAHSFIVEVFFCVLSWASTSDGDNHTLQMHGLCMRRYASCAQFMPGDLVVPRTHATAYLRRAFLASLRCSSFSARLSVLLGAAAFNVLHFACLLVRVACQCQSGLCHAARQ